MVPGTSRSVMELASKACRYKLIFLSFEELFAMVIIGALLVIPVLDLGAETLDFANLRVICVVYQLNY